MTNKHAFQSAGILATSMLLALPGDSAAAIDEFSPYAFAGVFYDSNVFRLPNRQAAIDVTGDDQMDDTTNHLGAGFNADWKLSRQHFLFGGRADQSRYHTFDQLDNTALFGQATWDWQIGNLWSGNLGTTYDKHLSSFNENRLPVKDMRTEKDGNFTAQYAIHPDWRLVAGLGVSDVEFQKRNYLNRKSNSGVFAVQYQNTRSSRVGVRFTLTDYDLNDVVVPGVGTVSNDYKEYNVSGVFYWEGSQKSTFELDLGYTRQKYDEVDLREFKGTTGNLTYHWMVTGKTKLDISVWHDTSTLDDEIEGYVVTTGMSLRPSWSVTPVISLGGVLQYKNDDFKGRNQVVGVIGGAKREDDTWLYGVLASWSPRTYVSLSLGLQQENRDSNVSFNDFDDTRADAELRFTF